MKTNLLSLLIAILVICGCKKAGDSAPTINITGVSDVTLYDTTKNHFRVKVTQSGGEHSEITLSVSDLPNGITAVIDTLHSMPPFSSTISFQRTGQINQGTYTAKVTASSPIGSASQSFKINVGPFNGWIQDGSKVFYASRIWTAGNSSAIIIEGDAAKGERLALAENSAIGADWMFKCINIKGVYKVPLLSSGVDGIRVECYPFPIGFFPADTAYATITNLDGYRIAVKIPPTRFGNTSTLEVDAHM